MDDDTREKLLKDRFPWLYDGPSGAILLKDLKGIVGDKTPRTAEEWWRKRDRVWCALVVNRMAAENGEWGRRAEDVLIFYRKKRVHRKANRQDESERDVVRRGEIFRSVRAVVSSAKFYDDIVEIKKIVRASSGEQVRAAAKMLAGSTRAEVGVPSKRLREAAVVCGRMAVAANSYQSELNRIVTGMPGAGLPKVVAANESAMRNLVNRIREDANVLTELADQLEGIDSSDQRAKNLYRMACTVVCRISTRVDRGFGDSASEYPWVGGAVATGVINSWTDHEFQAVGEYLEKVYALCSKVAPPVVELGIKFVGIPYVDRFLDRSGSRPQRRYYEAVQTCITQWQLVMNHWEGVQKKRMESVPAPTEPALSAPSYPRGDVSTLLEVGDSLIKRSRSFSQSLTSADAILKPAGLSEFIRVLDSTIDDVSGNFTRLSGLAGSGGADIPLERVVEGDLRTLATVVEEGLSKGVNSGVNSTGPVGHLAVSISIEMLQSESPEKVDLRTHLKFMDEAYAYARLVYQDMLILYRNFPNKDAIWPTEEDIVAAAKKNSDALQNLAGDVG